MNRYFVICMTDAGAYVFATRRYFTTYDAANDYCAAIEHRDPIIIEEDRPLILCTAERFEAHGEHGK